MKLVADFTDNDNPTITMDGEMLAYILRRTIVRATNNLTEEEVADLIFEVQSDIEYGTLPGDTASHY